MSKRTLIHTNTKQSFSITWADGCEVGCTRSRFTMPLLVRSLTQHKLSSCGRRVVWLTRTERVLRQWVLLWAIGWAHCVKCLKGTRMRCTPPQTSISGSHAACRRSRRRSANILKIWVTREQVCWLSWKLAVAARFMVTTLSQQSFHSLNCTTYSPLAIAKLATEKKKKICDLWTF